MQVANPIRAIVMDVDVGEDEPRNPICMINPEIIELGDELRLHEEIVEPSVGVNMLVGL